MRILAFCVASPNLHLGLMSGSVVTRSPRLRPGVPGPILPAPVPPQLQGCKHSSSATKLQLHCWPANCEPCRDNCSGEGSPGPGVTAVVPVQRLSCAQAYNGMQGC